MPCPCPSPAVELNPLCLLSPSRSQKSRHPLSARTRCPTLRCQQTGNSKAAAPWLHEHWVYCGLFPLLVAGGILMVCAFHATQAWQSHQALCRGWELPCPPTELELRFPHHRVVPAAGRAEHGVRSVPGFPGHQNPSECTQQCFGLFAAPVTVENPSENELLAPRLGAARDLCALGSRSSPCPTWGSSTAHTVTAADFTPL